MSRLKYAVIPTHNRPQDYADAYAAIKPQVDWVITVAHLAPYAGSWPTIWYEYRVPNISVMWNLGLDYAHGLANGRPYDVAVLNDDCIVPPDWFARVTRGMRRHNTAAGCVKRPGDHRMTGYAFILNGDAGLRADPQFQWWYGDDDLERQAGSVTFVNGQDVEHRHPNSTTVGRLAEIAAEDGLRYKEKWGP